MQIDHIAMYVNDLEAARDFFVSYFRAVPNEGYHNPKTDFRSYFLSFDQGARLEIMTKPNMEDEHFMTIHHPMSKDHHISFAAFVTSDRIQLVKFYPEGNAETRMQLRGSGYLYYYCNRHGLFRQKFPY